MVFAVIILIFINIKPATHIEAKSRRVPDAFCDCLNKGKKYVKTKQAIHCSNVAMDMVDPRMRCENSAGYIEVQHDMMLQYKLVIYA